MPEAVWKQREIAVLADSIRGESALESRSLGASGVAMHRFIFGEDRMQQALLPHSLEDYVGEENSVRVIEVFIDELDLAALGFSGMTRAATGRPAYHPSTLLKIYLYGYLNRLQSSRRLERETQRNVELMWLTGRLSPDFKTIADFRKDNGKAIRAVCGQFVELCRRLKLFTRAVVAIDGSKFKAVNNRDKNFTVAKVGKRMEQVDASIVRYLAALDRADREESDVAEAKTTRLKVKIAGLRRQMQRAVVAMAPKQTRFTRMRWLPTDQTPAREGLKRATALRGLKSRSFHSKAPARHGREPTAKSNPTNHMHPGRRRCFYLAVYWSCVASIRSRRFIGRTRDLAHQAAIKSRPPSRRRIRTANARSRRFDRSSGCELRAACRRSQTGIPYLLGCAV